MSGHSARICLHFSKSAQIKIDVTPHEKRVYKSFRSIFGILRQALPRPLFERRMRAPNRSKCVMVALRAALRTRKRCATSLLYGGDPRPNGVFVRHVARRTAGPRAKQGAPTRRPPVMGGSGTQRRLLSSGRTARAATRKARGGSAHSVRDRRLSPGPEKLKPRSTVYEGNWSLKVMLPFIRRHFSTAANGDT